VTSCHSLTPSSSPTLARSSSIPLMVSMAEIYVALNADAA
jgi:hypothetical protein